VYYASNFENTKHATCVIAGNSVSSAVALRVVHLLFLYLE